MKEHPALEAALEIGEAAFDQLGDNEFLKDIPIVGTVFKTCKAVGGIRERIYVCKLKAFFDPLKALHPDVYAKLLESLHAHADERQKVGEHLLLILEQISDLKKPQIMAVFFIAYLHGIIDFPFLLRSWDAIATAYAADLTTLLAITADPVPGGANAHLQYLYRTGLTMIEGGKTFGDVGSIHYKLSPFGTRFVNVYHENRGPIDSRG